MGLPHLHTLPGTSPHPSGGAVLPTTHVILWNLPASFDVGLYHRGPQYIKYGQYTRLFTLLIGGERPTLNEGSVCSLQSMVHVSNPCVTEAKTADPLCCAWVTSIMTIDVPTTAPGEDMSGRDRTTSSPYSPTQYNRPIYTSTYTGAFARTPTRPDEGVAWQGIRTVTK